MSQYCLRGGEFDPKEKKILEYPFVSNVSVTDVIGGAKRVIFEQSLWLAR